MIMKRTILIPNDDQNWIGDIITNKVVENNKSYTILCPTFIRRIYKIMTFNKYFDK